MLFNWIIPPTLQFIRLQLSEISPTLDQNLVMTLMRIFRGLMVPFENPAYYSVIEMKIRH